jgi:anti-sigma factor RsiW
MDEHEKTRKNLLELVAGSLPRAEEEAVRAHLGRCAACEREAEAWQCLVQDLQRLPAAMPAAVRLARITALAAARRAEVVARQRNTKVLVALALFSFLLFVAIVRLLSALTGRLGGCLDLSPALAFTLALAAWWGWSLLAGLGLVPLLREHRTDWKENRI